MVDIPHINKGEEVTIYTLPNCPNCEELKAKLDRFGIPYMTMRLDTPEGLSELRSNGCFSMQAPVLQIEKEMYSELF